ncbi:GPP34 family phosphoprotein [Kitasatospora sp. NBC_00240]|uniref:GOLPH3/VPS74 family protein n=1 Tax=Kitasatospora sp. NBC_00240 TaxID=2903567 RepID=UPI0022587565|nr:GPP34 family phosphoprotein [Kitasatospora sp. NBC_00240]MCX5212759.1 GPP34 family phosphoprotein [Kitasatospora sp. NBC_00240]
MTQPYARTIPEDLVLLCAGPAGGTVRMSGGFHRMLAGGVLAEMLVGGAIAVEGRHITQYQPFAGQDPVAAGVLARLGEAGKRRRPPTLDVAVRRIGRDAVGPALASLTARGLLSTERRRFLGVFPYRRHRVTAPGAGQEIAARVRIAALAPATAGARDRQLAGLLAAGGPARQVFPGPAGADVRRALKALVRELPIAGAVQRVISSDAAAASSG